MRHSARKLGIGLILIIVSCILSSSPAISKSLEQAKEVKLGVVMPLTGPVAYAGKLVIEGIQFAAEEINERGGIDGKTKIKLIIEDSRCKPTDSVSAVEKLIGLDQVSTVIGDFCSSATLADMEVAKRMKVPLLTPISIAPKITEMGNIWVFRACDDAEMMAKAFTKYAVKDRGIKNWAFIAVDNDYGHGSVEAYSKRLKKYGATVVFAEYYQQGESDYYSILTKLKASNADGLSLHGEALDNATTVKQFVELGLNKRIQLMDPTSGLFSDKFLELTKGAAEGMIGATRFVDSLPRAQAQEFVKRYSKRWGHNPMKSSQSGYDTMHIVAQAISRAGSLDPSKIREALTKTDYEGPQGKAYFDGTNQLIIDEYIVTIKDNLFVVLAGPIKVSD